MLCCRCYLSSWFRFAFPPARNKINYVCYSSYIITSEESAWDAQRERERERERWIMGRADQTGQAWIIAVVSSEGCAHQDEGAQGCLFLMVAVGTSASDVSQSESLKCSGFWEREMEFPFKFITLRIQIIQHITLSSKTLIIILQYNVLRIRYDSDLISNDSMDEPFAWVRIFMIWFSSKKNHWISGSFGFQTFLSVEPLCAKIIYLK